MDLHSHSIHCSLAQRFRAKAKHQLLKNVSMYHYIAIMMALFVGISCYPIGGRQRLTRACENACSPGPLLLVCTTYGGRKMVRRYVAGCPPLIWLLLLLLLLFCCCCCCCFWWIGVGGVWLVDWGQRHNCIFQEIKGTNVEY